MAQYDEVATAYAQRIAPRYRPIAELVSRTVSDADLAAASTVLEIASGTGLLTGLLLPRTRPGCRYLAVDVSPAMLQVGRSSAAAGALSVCADAAALPLRDGSTDLVVSSLGPLQEEVGLLAETLRVLRPGGRLVLSIWGDDYAEVRMLQAARDRLDLGEFPAAREEPALERLAEAGFEHARATRAVLTVEHESVADYLAYRASFGRPPFVPEARRADWLAAVETEAAAYVDGEGRVCLDWTIVVLDARRPQGA